MGEPALWQHLQDLGINVVHLNPVRRAGGTLASHSGPWFVLTVVFCSGLTTDLKWTPTTDGGYDRVSLEVDPLYGSDEDYRDLVRVAAQYNGYVAGDIVPGHTGTGADWQLAKMNYKDYPYLFHMIEVRGLLPCLSCPFTHCWCGADQAAGLVSTAQCAPRSRLGERLPSTRTQTC